jgi:hypothetical protein
VHHIKSPNYTPFLKNQNEHQTVRLISCLGKLARELNLDCAVTNPIFILTVIPIFLIHIIPVVILPPIIILIVIPTDILILIPIVIVISTVIYIIIVIAILIVIPVVIEIINITIGIRISHSMEQSSS